MGNIQLYALFKQGTQDPPIEESKAPGMFELKVRWYHTSLFSVLSGPIRLLPDRGHNRPIEIVAELVPLWGL